MKKKYAGIFNFQALLCILMFVVCGCVRDKEEPVWVIQPGADLPSFCVTTIDGNNVSSDESYLRDMEIIFFNTDCRDCREELPRLQKKYEENLSLPLNEQTIFICIAREEGESDIKAYWNEAGLTIPVAAQTDRSLYSKFASSGIPRIFKAYKGKITYAE